MIATIQLAHLIATETGKEKGGDLFKVIQKTLHLSHSKLFCRISTNLFGKVIYIIT